MKRSIYALFIVVMFAVVLSLSTGAEAHRKPTPTRKPTYTHVPTKTRIPTKTLLPTRTATPTNTPTATIFRPSNTPLPPTTTCYVIGYKSEPGFNGTPTMYAIWAFQRPSGTHNGQFPINVTPDCVVH